MDSTEYYKRRLINRILGIEDRLKKTERKVVVKPSFHTITIDGRLTIPTTAPVDPPGSLSTWGAGSIWIDTSTGLIVVIGSDGTQRTIGAADADMKHTPAIDTPTQAFVGAGDMTHSPTMDTPTKAWS